MSQRKRRTSFAAATIRGVVQRAVALKAIGEMTSRNSIVALDTPSMSTDAAVTFHFDVQHFDNGYKRHDRASLVGVV